MDNIPVLTNSWPRHGNFDIQILVRYNCTSNNMMPRVSCLFDYGARNGITVIVLRSNQGSRSLTSSAALCESTSERTLIEH